MNPHNAPDTPTTHPLGKAMNSHNASDTTDRHAIVIGGSVAGMLAARVLSDFFARVTVVERDQFPDQATFRKGVPQGRHAHGLLVRGINILEEYFPRFVEALLKDGAQFVNMGSGVTFYIAGKRLPSFESALELLSCSRPLIEHVIRRKLQDHTNVQILSGCRVEGLCTDAEQRRATGIRYRQRDEESGALSELSADLVVDASGRRSPLPKWLAQLGYTPPESVSVDAKAGYASRLYRLPAGKGDVPMAYYMPEAPQQSRGGIVMPIESDADERLILVTLIGLNGDYPPSDAAEFEAFARGLPASLFKTVIDGAEPLDAPYGYRQVENRLRKYDKLPRYLEGVVAVGDSVYALNPVYGQGMTVAALASRALHEELAAHQARQGLDDLTGLAKTFQRKLATVIDAPWQLATGQDLRWPVAAEGHQTPIATRLVQRYFDTVLRTMPGDTVVAEAFFHVQNMLKPPTTLFHPTVVYRVLRARRATRRMPLEASRAPRRRVADETAERSLEKVS